MCLCLQVGLTEASVLREYHPDAQDLISVDNNLEKLLLDLRDPHKRFPRQVYLSLMWMPSVDVMRG